MRDEGGGGVTEPTAFVAILGRSESQQCCATRARSENISPRVTRCQSRRLLIVSMVEKWCLLVCQLVQACSLAIRRALTVESGRKRNTTEPKARIGEDASSGTMERIDKPTGDAIDGA